MAMPSPVVVPASGTHSATVILLHGLGDQGSSWAPVASQMSLPHCKFIFPSAATRPVSINMGAPCPAWADIKGLSPDSPDDEEGATQAIEYVHKIIAEEVAAGIPPSRIVVGGFSQGAAISCLSAMTHKEPLGGCFLLSGWLMMRAKVPTMMSPTFISTKVPVLHCHGTNDMVVPFLFGQVSSQAMEQMGVNVDFKPYPGMAHESSPQEVSDLKAFLHGCLPAAPPAPIPDDPSSLSVKELKAILKERSVDASDCFEKADLLAKVKSLL